MEVALRECIATAMWKANVNTGLRVSIVPLIQNVLMELFRKTDLFEPEESIVVPTTATMALSNASILASYAAFKSAQHAAHIARLRAAHPKLSVFTDDEVTALFHEVVSCFQSKGGKFFEAHIENLLREAGIPFKAQVHVDARGVIVEGRNDGDTIPDIVFGNPVVGTHISQYAVMSLKTTSRERAKLDTAWTYKHPPKLFLYATMEDDYPSPKTFDEGPTRKLICATPKARDARQFKLGFEHLVAEVQAALA